jgi:hypothetical protein
MAAMLAACDFQLFAPNVMASRLAPALWSLPSVGGRAA